MTRESAGPEPQETALCEPSKFGGRYAVLDTYRFLAAIGIVLYHFEKQFAPELGGKTDVFDSFHLMVDFFFVLSGFVLMHTYGTKLHSLADIGLFIQKRLARIYPLHFVTTLAFIGLAVLVHRLNINVNNPRILDTGLTLPHLLLVHSWGATDHLGLDYPSWSISAEFFVYLLFPLFVAIIFRVKAAGALMLAAACAVLIALIRSQYHLPGFLSATFDFGNFRAVPSFLAGMAIEVAITAIQPKQTSMPFGAKPSTYWLVAHGFAAILLVGMLAHLPEWLIFIMLPVAVALIALAERSGAPTFLAHPVFVRLGDTSFGIYLLHPFVAIVVALILRKLGCTSLPWLVLGAAAGLTLSILVARASFVWFETPMRRLFSRPFFGTAAPAMLRKMNS